MASEGHLSLQMELNRFRASGEVLLGMSDTAFFLRFTGKLGEVPRSGDKKHMLLEKIPMGSIMIFVKPLQWLDATYTI